MGPVRTHANWTFGAFIVIVLHAISVYTVAALVLPDVSGETIVDLRDHYFAHRSCFFGALFANIVLSGAKDLALEGHLPGRTGESRHGISSFPRSGTSKLRIVQCAYRIYRQSRMPSDSPVAQIRFRCRRKEDSGA
jgi:hypothetical protein